MASGSVAVTVVTAVPFSARTKRAVARPPSDVMVGVSLPLTIVTAMDWVTTRLPSEACTWTS